MNAIRLEQTKSPVQTWKLDLGVAEAWLNPQSACLATLSPALGLNACSFWAMSWATLIGCFRNMVIFLFLLLQVLKSKWTRLVCCSEYFDLSSSKSLFLVSVHFHACVHVCVRSQCTYALAYQGQKSTLGTFINCFSTLFFVVVAVLFVCLVFLRQGLTLQP